MVLDPGHLVLTLHHVASLAATEKDDEALIAAGSVCMVLLAGFILLLSVKAGFIAMAVWMDSTWPKLVHRTVEHYQQRPRRCVLVGLVNTCIGILLALILVNSPVAVISIVLVLALLTLAALGYTAGYRSMARRLRPEEGDTNRALLLGGITIEALFLFPGLGQLFSAGMLIRGIGAASLAILTRKDAQGA